MTEQEKIKQALLEALKAVQAARADLLDALEHIQQLTSLRLDVSRGGQEAQTDRRYDQDEEPTVNANR